MRLLSILIILAFTSALFAETITVDTTKLSPDVLKIIDNYDINASKIARKANQDVVKEKEKTTKALESAMEKATKAGDLDTALAIKSAMQKLADSDKHEVGFDLLGEPMVPKIVGSWKINVNNSYFFTWDVTDDNKVTSIPSTGGGNGTWELKDGIYHVVWPNGNHDKLYFDGEKLVGDTSKGIKTLTAEKN